MAFRARPRLVRPRAETFLSAERPAAAVPAAARAVTGLEEATWARTCFYSSPIGEVGSEEREHADGFLEYLVRPAIAAYDPKMKVVRADELASSPITYDVFEHVQKSGLMIADLSFHNPNVFHEIGMRTGRPCIQIARTNDPIPANVRDVRTVLVDVNSQSAGDWGFTAELRNRQDEITRRARWALREGST